MYTPTCQQETSNMSGSMYSYVQMAKPVNLEDKPCGEGAISFKFKFWGRSLH